MIGYAHYREYGTVSGPRAPSDGFTWRDFAMFARAVRLASDFDRGMKQIARLVPVSDTEWRRRTSVDGKP